MLKDDSNTWIQDPGMIKYFVQNYFKDLFRNQNDTLGTCLFVSSHNLYLLRIMLIYGAL